mgnify:CR=1 FL=1
MKILLNAIFTTFTFFSSINAQSDPQDKNLIVPKNQIKSFKKGLVIIGPEGGFSPEEELFLEGGSKTIKIHLSTPILRAPHALSVAIGFLLGCLVE